MFGIIIYAASILRYEFLQEDLIFFSLLSKENYIKKHQKDPTVSEISAETGISREDIVMAMDAVQSPVSLYEPVFSESGDTLYIMDQVSDRKKQRRHMGRTPSSFRSDEAPR